MTKNDEGTDWGPTDKALTRRDGSGALSNQPLAPSPHLPSAPGGRMPEGPAGLLAKLQTGTVERRAKVEMVRAWHDGQLKVAQHQISEAVRIKKAEATGIAEKILAQLDSDRIDFLRTLGLKNTGDRQKALLELSAQTSQLLAEVQKQDMPDQLLDSTINGVIRLHERFFNKLLTEMGD